jgi:hypothetical protein
MGIRDTAFNADYYQPDLCCRRREGNCAENQMDYRDRHNTNTDCGILHLDTLPPHPTNLTDVCDTWLPQHSTQKGKRKDWSV